MNAGTSGLVDAAFGSAQPYFYPVRLRNVWGTITAAHKVPSLWSWHDPIRYDPETWGRDPAPQQ